MCVILFQGISDTKYAGRGSTPGSDLPVLQEGKYPIILRLIAIFSRPLVSYIVQYGTSNPGVLYKPSGRQASWSTTPPELLLDDDELELLELEDEELDEEELEDELEDDEELLVEVS